MRTVLLFCLLLSLSLPSFCDLCSQSSLRTFSDQKYLPDEIIVKFKPDLSRERIDGLISFYGTEVISVSPYGGFFRLRIPRGRTVEEMVEIFSKQPEVEYAEPNYKAFALFVPNDPYYGYQWNFHSSFGINVEKAWDIATGEGVIVAVLDTGVAYEDFGGFRQAPDLRGTSFVEGYNFVEGDAHPNDDNGHGTHVAGTIAQRTDNRIGVAGVAFNCSIMPIKVLDRNGEGNYAWIADGIYYAVNHEAQVINMSLGGSEPSGTLEEALAYAYRAGVILVAAAGNEFLEGDSPAYPAAYDEYCIAVGAVRYDGKRAYYSNSGWYIDIVAPGGDLRVDQNGDGYPDGILQQTFVGDPNDLKYWFFQGTSMAAPHVSGVCALLISKGVKDPARIREALFLSARDLGDEGWDEEYGWGLLDAWKALNYSFRRGRNLAIPCFDAPSEVISGDVAELRVKVQNLGDVRARARVSVRDLKDGVSIYESEVELDPMGSKDLRFRWDTSGASRGVHRLVAEIYEAEGDPSDNVREALVKVISEENRTLIVKDVDLRIWRLSFFFYAYAIVTVTDGYGEPVEGAIVEGMWHGAFNMFDIAFTDKRGRAVFTSGLVTDVKHLRFSVLSVSKPGWIYKPKSPKPVFTKLEGEICLRNALYNCYPNPSNSEVWMPFELAEGTEVRIEIYNASGKLVRKIDLGHKAPGRYTGYWDGRNEGGEEVSSGVYFCTLIAGDFRATRRVLIIK